MSGSVNNYSVYVEYETAEAFEIGAQDFFREFVSKQDAWSFIKRLVERARVADVVLSVQVIDYAMDECIYDAFYLPDGQKRIHRSKYTRGD